MDRNKREALRLVFKLHQGARIGSAALIAAQAGDFRKCAGLLEVRYNELRDAEPVPTELGGPTGAVAIAYCFASRAARGQEVAA